MGHDQGEGIDSADDDDDDDDDDEGNKPTVPVNPTSPYVPLVLGQMADGKDAVIPARLNQYLYDFQREVGRIVWWF
ncbi:hypothetical protein SARC_13882 [Sphaeroforma arctica JP610]|uniref:Uncharacterized protein n=1 Tax=Sphaeroforma arctica JP610 TaxID=667725 RepID=A0A0L0FA22_9EUKA|nr:hypothetical protein SARC_13882 [Sphaeroforma arctica JP610]KNC73560.1 hypothetical protein SARC_13882 [Sphaeroforma arctica JP610]|eukprot:XP_014147462.1 hypothetical protein SARC_13882 [Sphaeroforma arctica JP610]